MRNDIRSITLDQSELRAVEVNGKVRIEGLVVPYGVATGDLFFRAAGFVEIIQAGAFDAFVATNPDVPLLAHHDDAWPIARTRAGTLRLFSTPQGIRFSAEPGDQSYAKDVVTSIQRGDVGGMSFMFTPGATKATRSRTPDGKPLRIVTSAQFAEISVVTQPAYDSTFVSAETRAVMEAPLGPSLAMTRAEMELRLRGL